MTRILILDASGISARSKNFSTYSQKYILGPMGNYFEGRDVEVIVEVASEVQNVEGIHALVDLVDAVLIPGGEDVHPAFYDGDPVYTGGGLHTAKGDLHQMEAVRYAVMNGKRVFGICRGLQVINVALGGTLIQHFEGHRNRSYTELPGRFNVTNIETSHPILSEFTNVRCSHHQSVKELGSGLEAIAFSSDGIVEAIEHRSGLVLAVQFHPEAEQTFQEQIPAIADWLTNTVLAEVVA